MFTDEELELIKRAMGPRPDFKTSTGFTGNKKSKEAKEKFVVGKNRRKTGHLSNKERKKLTALHNQVDSIFVGNSMITRKEGGKPTKKDMRKGKNNNLGADGIHGRQTFQKNKSICKTFVKYCFEHYDAIDHVSEIKPEMALDWMEHMMKKGKPNGDNYSVKTLTTYWSAVKKMGEGAEKTGGEFQRLGRISSDKFSETLKKLREMNGYSQYSRKEYKRGKNKDGQLGYSYKEGRKITKKAYELSPLYGLLYETLNHSCPRHDELRKIKWRQIDIEQNRIYLDDPNQTKGSRPRFVPIPEETSKKFRAVMDSGLVQNDDSRVWGKSLSTKDIYKLTKHLCREAHVGYAGIHDFRRAAHEYHDREIHKGLKQGKITRKNIEREFLEHVSLDPRLNPIEVKKEKLRDADGKVVLEYVRDRNGKIRFHDNGYPRQKAVWVEKRDENGNPVKGPRYTPEEVAEWRIDKLINMRNSQILGHNRSDATSPYKNG